MHRVPLWPAMLAVALCLAACAGCAHRERAYSFQMTGAATGDSVCAMLARVTITVVDRHGTVVPDAEVWDVETFDATPPIADRAILTGRTDQAGHLVTSHCYAGASEVAIWSGRDHATRLTYLVMHERVGYRRVTAEPPTTDVYRDGDPRESRVGRPINYGYEMAIRVELPGQFEPN